jgi:hypothetical protein
LFPSMVEGKSCVLEFEIDDTLFISHAITVPVPDPESDEDLNESEDLFPFSLSGSPSPKPVQSHRRSSDDPNTDRLVSLSISLVLKAGVNRQVVSDLREMVKQLAAALSHAETVDGYLSQQTKKIFRVRDRWIKKQLDSHYDKFTQAPVKGPMRPPDHSQLNEDLLHVSTFAGELRVLYHSIVASSTVDMSFNGWVHFSFVVRQSEPYFPSVLPSFRPYHALLLLPATSHTKGRWNIALECVFISPTDLALPADASVDIRRLLQLAHPTRSLEELQVELNIPLGHLYRLSAQLVHWRRARIIHRVSLESVFRCDSTVIHPSSLQEFSALFPSLLLGDCMQLFVTPTKLSDVLEQFKQMQLLQVIIWMLQWDLLVEIHQYLYFIPQLSHSPEQCQVIIEGLNDGPSKAYLLLLRILPHCTGKCTIREILWRENISYESLEAVLQKFSSILLRTSHELTPEPDSFCLR